MTGLGWDEVAPNYYRLIVGPVSLEVSSADWRNDLWFVNVDGTWCEDCPSLGEAQALAIRKGEEALQHMIDRCDAALARLGGDPALLRSHSCAGERKTP